MAAVQPDGEWCLGEEWCLDSDSGHAALYIDAFDGPLPTGENEWQCYDPTTQSWGATMVTVSAAGAGGSAAPEAVPPTADPEEAAAPPPPPAAAPATKVSSLRMSPAQRKAAEAAREAANEAQREAELQAARAKFDEIDQDGSGSLDTDEVGELAKWTLQSFNKSGGGGRGGAGVMSDENIAAEVAKLMEQADKDGDGELDFDEFAVRALPRPVLCCERARTHTHAWHSPVHSHGSHRRARPYRSSSTSRSSGRSKSEPRRL
jgi:hypothetical protein